MPLRSVHSTAKPRDVNGQPQSNPVLFFGAGWTRSNRFEMLSGHIPGRSRASDRRIDRPAPPKLPAEGQTPNAFSGQWPGTAQAIVPSDSIATWSSRAEKAGSALLVKRVAATEGTGSDRRHRSRSPFSPPASSLRTRRRGRSPLGSASVPCPRYAYTPHRGSRTCTRGRGGCLPLISVQGRNTRRFKGSPPRMVAAESSVFGSLVDAWRRLVRGLASVVVRRASA